MMILNEAEILITSELLPIYHYMMILNSNPSIGIASM